MPSDCQLNNANRSTCPDCFKVKKDTTYYQDAEINNCIGSDGDWSNYDLYFASKSIDSYASQTWSPDLSMFTLCFWMQTSDSDKGVTFSYALQSADNELTLFKNELAINNVEMSYNLSDYYDGRRHHVCVTWENKAGSWKLNVNGKVINSGSRFKVNHVIRGRGVLVIGQDQDRLLSRGDGAFQLKQSFMGSISGMNLWSRYLSDEEILRMSETCNFGNGDVLKWSDFLVATHNVEVKCPSNFKI
ncbi:neuronal pentraxin-2-like isoform X2 [Montipora foliosa]